MSPHPSLHLWGRGDMSGRRGQLVGLAGALLLAASGAGAGQAPTGAGGSANAEAHFELGEMHHRQVFEALDKAIEEYERAIRLRGDFAEAHYNLGLAYHSKAKLGSDDQQLYRRALQEYRLYLRHSPNGPLAAKAKQNIAAVETLLGEAPRKNTGSTKRKRPAR